jgi:hypothetical protein
MWIFTKYGFYSAVRARQGDGVHGAGLDPTRVMVRSRLRAHLDALKERFPDLLGDREVRESNGTDYRWRIFVDQARWAEVTAALAADIDYGNFKDEVHRVHGHDNYERALHHVWSVMYELQHRQ